MSDPATPYQTGEPTRTAAVPPESPYPAPDSAIDRPLDDEWEPEFDELPVRPRRRWVTPVNLALLAVLLLAGGFVGGVLVEKGQTSSSGSGATGLAALARRAALAGTSTASGSGAGAAARSVFGGSGASSANLTTGTVSFVSHGILYVTDTEGNTVPVALASGGTVTRNDVSSVSKVHPGDTVVVSGAKASNGTVEATSIRATSAGAASSGASGLSGLFGGGGAASLFGGASSSSSSKGGSSGAGSSGSSGGPSLFGSG